MRFSDALSARLALDAGRPLVTFYDEDSTERTELSATTYANWVYKTANVLVEEFDVEAGDTVDVTLPTHWLGPIFLGASLLVGAHCRPISRPASQDAYWDGDLLIGGPEVSTQPEALACSLHPMAISFSAPITAHDFGALWPGQPDVFLGDPAASADLAAIGSSAASSDRVLTDVNPLSRPELFLNGLLGTGSLVIVARPAESSWTDLVNAEKITHQVRN